MITSSKMIWYVMRASGVVSLGLLSLVVVLGLLTTARASTRRTPAFVTAELHKRLTIFTMAFLGIHILSAVLDTYVHIGLLGVVVPLTSHYRPLATGIGTVAFDMLLAVALSSAFRQRMSARAWRTVHWLSYGCWPVAVLHSVVIGTDVAQGWMDLFVVACVLAVGIAFLWRWVSHLRQVDRAARVAARTHAPRGIPAPGRSTGSTSLLSGRR
jgi:DMSO/TMAO reductase YedYZ heme-binding membrane subunit